MKMLALGIVLGVLIALGGSVFAHRDPPEQRVAAPTPAAKQTLSAADAAKISEVIERVEREYVDKVDDPTLVDNALLEPVAAVCAELGRDDFMFVTSPLRVEGGTGSPANPLAIL